MDEYKAPIDEPSDSMSFLDKSDTWRESERIVSIFTDLCACLETGDFQRTATHAIELDKAIIENTSTEAILNRLVANYSITRTFGSLISLTTSKIRDTVSAALLNSVFNIIRNLINYADQFKDGENGWILISAIMDNFVCWPEHIQANALVCADAVLSACSCEPHNIFPWIIKIANLTRNQAVRSCAVSVIHRLMSRQEFPANIEMLEASYNPDSSIFCREAEVRLALCYCVLKLSKEHAQHLVGIDAIMADVFSADYPICYTLMAMMIEFLDFETMLRFEWQKLIPLLSNCDFQSNNHVYKLLVAVLDRYECSGADFLWQNEFIRTVWSGEARAYWTNSTHLTFTRLYFRMLRIGGFQYLDEIGIEIFTEALEYGDDLCGELADTIVMLLLSWRLRTSKSVMLQEWMNTSGFLEMAEEMEPEKYDAICGIIGEL